MRIRSVVAAALLAAPLAASLAQPADLVIAGGWVRATPPGAPTTAGYGELRNDGEATLRITGFASPVAREVSLHDVRMEDGQARMRAVEGAVELAPGETLTLAPGGHHLMFMQLDKAIAAGDDVPLTLTLDDGSSVALTLPARDAAPGQR